MIARFLLTASLCSACSLEGLADGGSGGGGGAPSTTTTTGGAGGEGGMPDVTGGAGGEPPVSRFVWIESIGNEAGQATSPFSTDPHGSSLRMSEPDETGGVWLAVVTSGVLDPDGVGGFAPMGMTDMRSLFLIELQADGAVSAFHGYVGPPANIENGLSVDGVTRSGAGLVVAGNFRTGSLDLDIGVITQSNTGADDGFLLLADADGQAIAARHVTGVSGDVQTARAVALRDDTLFLAGKFKQSWAIKDAATGDVDAGCAFDDQKEIFERSYVTSLDAGTLACDTLYTLTATDNGAAQQVFGVAADASGVYVTGSFTRQIISGALTVPAISGEEGFVAALKPTLAPGAVWIARATSSQGGANDALRSIYIDGNRLVVGGYIASGTGAQTPTFGLLATGTVCPLDAPLGIDGFVGVLKKSNGDCLAAARFGEDGVDQVRSVAIAGNGVIASGFTDGISGLEAGIGAPLTRNGFLLHLDADLQLTSGIALGGTSLDYVDAACAVDNGVLVAGSFGLPFDFLESQNDFFVGKLTLE